MNDLNLILEKHNPQIFERVIIGTLLSNRDAYKLYNDNIRHKVKGIMFSDETRVLFSVISEMIECSDPLRNYLIIEKCKDVSYPISADEIQDYRRNEVESNFTKTVDSFIENWYQFNLMKNGLEYANNIQNGINVIDAHNLMMRQNEDIEAIKEQTNDKIDTLSEIASKFIDEIDARRHLENKLSGLSFRVKKLDDMTGGVHSHCLYFIPGAGGDGKTTLAMQLASDISEYYKVDYYSLEMSKAQLIPKFLSAKTGISKGMMQHANVTDFDIEKLNKAKDSINDNLTIIDHIFDLEGLKRSIKSRFKKNKTAAIFIDNRVNIKHNLKGSNADEKTISLSYEFKTLCMELGVPIFMLVHKNKDNSSRSDKTPNNGDIKYGGDVAADVIMFPYRPIITEETRRHDNFLYCEWVITKNRVLGDIGTIPMLYDENRDSFYQMGLDGMPIIGYDPYTQTHNFNVAEIAKEVTKENNIISRSFAPVDDEIPF